ncbi:MAG: hypothetical protein IH965_02980 [Gemmatimonadetes bacterium]|nr:hypothetical protein [Gemmatimonadota bacterium]
MAAELGGSQISALLESVPGIANVLRSSVADALVNTIRSAARLRPFSRQDAEELVQYAVRRGLIGTAEGDEVLADVRQAGKTSRGRSAARTRKAKKKVAKKKVVKPKAARKKIATKRKTATKRAESKTTKRR